MPNSLLIKSFNHAPTLLTQGFTAIPFGTITPGLSPLLSVDNDQQLVQYAKTIFDVGASLTYATTVTIKTCTFTLNTSLGVPIFGPIPLTPTPATGTTITAAIQINTISMPSGAYAGLPLPPGVYEGLFQFARNSREIDVYRTEILLFPTAPAACTYDVTNFIGQTRLLCLDTDTTHAFFADDELNLFGSRCAYVPETAASYALEMLAIDAARLPLAVKIGPFSSENSTSTKNAIADRAASLRKDAPIMPAVSRACGPSITTANPPHIRSYGPGTWVAAGPAEAIDPDCPRGRPW